MDWLQFIASIVGSIAWPFVVSVFVFLIRNHLAGLAARIEELTLPGGTGIKLSKQVEKGREQAELVEAEQKVEPPSVATLDPGTLELANQFPEAAVLEAFKEVEGTLLQIRNRLPDGTLYRTASEIVNYLASAGSITENTRQLFDGLRRSRNEAAHAKGGDRLTPGEAIELVRQARLLLEIFRRRLVQLTPPPTA